MWGERDVQEKDSKNVVNLYVTDYIFPKMKFVHQDLDLDYTERKKSLCRLLIRDCNIGPNVDKRIWWAEANKWVRCRIANLRNDKNTSMKWAFMGE